jgi:glycosyltransferase involved in cell wall biosynthesis
MNLFKTVYDFHKYVVQQKNDNGLEDVLSLNNGENDDNKFPLDNKSIIFVLPSIITFSGGTTSVLRIGSYLARKGKDVYFTSYENQTSEQMEQNAKTDLKDVQGSFITFADAQKRQFDICIATNYKSVYWTKLLIGYKMYFVQDYEPLFYPMNEEYLLAENSYRQGYHIVSLGGWNASQINKFVDANIRVDIIDFPYDHNEYHSIKRSYDNYPHKKKITIAVYIKNEGKRLPIILQWLMGRLKEEFLKNNIEMEVLYFGMVKQYPLKNGVNLGKLGKNDLLKLYRKADFGMVASMTNISLVPYEMLACGLPLIEFKQGSYEYFLPKESAILTDLNYKELSSFLLDMIRHPDKIENMVKAGFLAINKVSWDKTCQQFFEIIEGITK